ncbi:MAG: response regulator [Deltaproteobacteria bacterium]|nr:response regulator [Deltaproteobacteria bacterium]
MSAKPAILLVDDEARFRETSGRLLKRLSYEVILAENGQAALELLSRHSIDVILLDLKMPVMGGEEFLKIMRPVYPHIPVVILTGHGSLDVAVECMTRGAYYFISKPIDLDFLVLTIEKALEKKKLEEQARQLQEETVRNLLELNTEKKRLETIIQCLANGVMVTNKELEVTLYNRALLQLLDLPEKIQKPVPLSEILTDSALFETLERIQRDENTDQDPIFQEIRVGDKILRAISVPNLEPDRHVFWTVSGTVTVLEDITAFKKLDQMKSDFVNMVAHELRSPLVSIRQLQSVLAEGLAGPLQEKQEDFVRRGIRKIDALLDLINDLLDVAKLEAGRLTRRQVSTDVGKIIEELVALTAPRAKDHGITLHFSSENLKPIIADPKNIEEIVNNLLSNAVNYSPQGGDVKISARVVGDFMEIKVSDQGIGIPPQEISKIFEKFYRVKDPKTRAVAGTGLGLSIVKGIVEAYHGSIDVESSVNAGTSFRVLLPLVKEEV